MANLKDSIKAIDLKDTIKTILTNSRPFVQKIIDEKVIPAIKTFAYTNFQKKADKLISNLLKLKEKAAAETNEDKKQAHLIGLKLGARALIAFGEKLIEAGKILLGE